MKVEWSPLFLALALCGVVQASPGAPTTEVLSIINPGGKFTPTCLATSTVGDAIYGIYDIQAGESAWISITVSKGGVTKMIYSDEIPFLFPNRSVDSIPAPALKDLAKGYFRKSISRAGGYNHYVRQNFASPNNPKGIPFPKGVPGEALKELASE